MPSCFFPLEEILLACSLFSNYNYSYLIFSRHPSNCQRPDFTEVTQQLSFPDPKLLMWSDEDRSVHPEATKLGADLLCAQELFKDLQTKYIIM